MSTATETPVASTVPATKWAVDPIHSAVGFEVTHMVVSKYRGTFHDYEVTLDTTGGEGNYKLNGTVRVNSVETRNADLTGHLQTPDFFDAENHPEITFSSSSLDIDNDGNVKLLGELTLRGVTKPVEITGEYRYVEAGMTGQPAIGLDLQTVVNRHDYGIDWNAPLPAGGFALAKDVKLTVEVELGPVEEN